jgi:hypothetical protein
MKLRVPNLSAKWLQDIGAYQRDIHGNEVC